MFVVSLATFFGACFVTFAHITSTSPLFVSFAIFRAVSKVKEKGCFDKKFCKFKILFECEIYISYIPLNDYMDFKTVIFFSHAHTHKYFFPLLQPFFRIFFPIMISIFQSSPYSEDPFLILGNARFHNRFYPSRHGMSLRDLNQISIERDISETSQKHLKRDFFETSLRRLKYISKRLSFL